MSDMNSNECAYTSPWATEQPRDADSSDQSQLGYKPAATQGPGSLHSSWLCRAPGILIWGWNSCAECEEIAHLGPFGFLCSQVKHCPNMEVLKTDLTREEIFCFSFLFPLFSLICLTNKKFEIADLRKMCSVLTSQHAVLPQLVLSSDFTSECFSPLILVRCLMHVRYNLQH